jgi:hypothetical protein
LSPEGKRALFGLFDSELVQVFVQWADELGLWVVRDRRASGEVTVMLIKWMFFDSASLDFVILPDLPTGRTVGFQK